MTTSLILVRHGETTWNRERRYQGQQDSPLSSTGLKQAEKTGRYLAAENVSAVYSSDLQRAHLTAKFIARHHNLTPIMEPRLREISFGVWEGLTREEVLKKHPRIYQSRQENMLETRVPGGELPQEVVERVRSVFKQLVAEHKGEVLVVVAHGACLRLTISAILGIPLQKSPCLRLSNAGISRLLYSENKSRCPWEILGLNSVAHLHS